MRRDKNAEKSATDCHTPQKQKQNTMPLSSLDILLIIIKSVKKENKGFCGFVGLRKTDERVKWYLCTK